MMTTRQARRLQDDHGQAARDLQNTRKGELQAAWRDECQRSGVLLTGPMPATKDGLIQDILSWRFPVAALNEAAHVLYHAPSSSWPACNHCQARPTTTSSTTNNLVPGDVVLAHGMRIRVDDVRSFVPLGERDRVFSCPGTVLNIDEVLEQRVVPASMLQAFGYVDDEGFAPVRRDAWTIQGTAATAWIVELPRPAAPINPEPDRRPRPARLDGCTCEAIAGSHKPPCQWAAR